MTIIPQFLKNAQWKNPDTKGHINVWFHSYKCPEGFISLKVQWLRLCASSAGGMGLILVMGWGVGSREGRWYPIHCRMSDSTLGSSPSTLMPVAPALTQSRQPKVSPDFATYHQQGNVTLNWKPLPPNPRTCQLLFLSWKSLSPDI